MKHHFLFILLFNILIGNAFSQQSSLSIIPQPCELIQKKGSFSFNPQTTVSVSADQKEAKAVADFFVQFMRPATGFKYTTAAVKGTDPKAGVFFKINPTLANLGEEGYKLDVSSSLIVIEAANAKGLFYGFQSLRQLLPANIESPVLVKKVKWNVPAVSITDTPRFEWRGFMQDVSRTFYSVDVLKKYIDLMALYKLNVFHLHLTDDQGWRIEIKAFPKLTEKKSTVFDARFNQPAERSGYYTQDQLRDLVKYAQDRKITIVPEIDLPGHSWAAIIAYPQLGSNTKLSPDYIFPFLASWGIWGSQFTPNLLDPTKEEVYEFLNTVFTEVVAIFPSKYIHFGGDEANHRIWEKEPRIQEFIKAKGFKSGKDLQTYFVARVIDMIKSKGRSPMGWNDILEGDHTKLEGTAIMSWLGEDAIVEAAKGGFQVVGTPAGSVYFDITQADRNDGTLSDLAYGNINTLEVVYTYNPTEGLTPAEEKYVLGSQANMWPALAIEVKDVNVQLFPRMIALAEGAWTPLKDKNYSNFTNRLEKQYPRLDMLKIDYYRKGGYITGTWEPKDLTTEFATRDWDVSKKVYANGRIMAGFYFTKGTNFMQIERVDLLENGKVISSDVHPGLADTFRGTNKTKTFQYNLKVDAYKKGAKYTLRAKIKGDKGTDSYGNFTFNLCPYVPFSIIEPHQ